MFINIILIFAPSIKDLMLFICMFFASVVFEMMYLCMTFEIQTS